MNKLQKILAGVLCLQLLLVALVIVINQPKTIKDEPLMMNLANDKITSIQISDNENNSVIIKKVSETWVLANTGNYPVITSNVTDLMDSLLNIRTGRLVTNTEASHQRLEVENDHFQRKIEVKMTDGSYTVFIGSSPAQSNVHVRLSNQDSVYLTNAISTTKASAQVSNWVDTTVTQIPSDSVKSIAVTTSNGLLQFELGTNNQWTCLQFSADETLDISKWTTYLTAFTNLRMVTPVSDLIDESYGLSSPLAKVVIQYTENNEPKTGELLIGKQDETDSNYYAKWSLSPYVVKIASFNAERMINITKSELISLPATPTTAP
ncbi:MAG: DUF4340 domain-containing protein [Anaerolineaceae bacterium]|nr:DUF4340 domain-containing protein [Anaerolineaceae bacterium]